MFITKTISGDSSPVESANSGLLEPEIAAKAKAESESDKIGPPNDFSAFETVAKEEFWPKNKLAANSAAMNRIGKMAYEILSEIVLMVK